MVTNKKRIQAYVNLSNYESLKSLAEDSDISLSEYVAKFLEIHLVATGSDEVIVDGYSSNYLTREQLFLMFQKFCSEIDREVIHELNTVEISWEERVKALAAINSGIVKIGVKCGLSKSDLIRYNNPTKEFMREVIYSLS